MRSSRCSRRGPSSGLYVAISSGRHLQECAKQEEGGGQGGDMWTVGNMVKMGLLA
jgi:hypothetical protein